MATEAKFTPSPWAYVDDGEIYHADAEGVFPRIATVDMGNVSAEQAEADCRLITAAPDLYAALTEAKAALEYAARGADVITSDKLAMTIDRIDAVLAKAVSP